MVEHAGKKLRDFLIYFSSMLTIIASIVVIVVLVYPFDVLQEWDITTDKTSYTEGETISIRSRYHKTMEAESSVELGLQCENDNGSLQVYPISVQTGRGMVGEQDLTYSLTIPIGIINGLPTKCRVVADATYRVFGIRTVVEHAQTEFFAVKPLDIDKVLQ